MMACGTHSRLPRRARSPSPIEITRADIASVETARGGDDGNQPVLQIELTPDAGQRLEDFTTAHVGEEVAIVVDGEVVLQPRVRDPIAGGRLEISGHSEADLQEIERKLRPTDPVP